MCEKTEQKFWDKGTVNGRPSFWTRRKLWPNTQALSSVFRNRVHRARVPWWGAMSLFQFTVLIHKVGTTPARPPGLGGRRTRRPRRFDAWRGTKAHTCRGSCVPTRPAARQANRREPGAQGCGKIKLWSRFGGKNKSFHRARAKAKTDHGGDPRRLREASAERRGRPRATPPGRHLGGAGHRWGQAGVRRVLLKLKHGPCPDAETAEPVRSLRRKAPPGPIRTSSLSWGRLRSARTKRPGSQRPPPPRLPSFPPLPGWNLPDEKRHSPNHSLTGGGASRPQLRTRSRGEECGRHVQEETRNPKKQLKGQLGGRRGPKLKEMPAAAAARALGRKAGPT